jgi:hypothetical protein
MDNLRYIAIPILIFLAILPHYVFADNENQLDTTLMPNKIITNTTGIIQVYPKNFTSTIDGLVATSSDSSIVQILGVEKDVSHNVFNVKISALNAGQVTISMAASGFASLELPVTIYPDSKEATNLLIKATPQTFSTSGPNAGYISVETVNANGVPTPVSVDTPITLSVSDNTIVNLAEDQIMIKQGSYFATEKFVVAKPGSAQIYASASSMQPVSTSVTINNDAVPYTLQVYAYPPIVNVNKDAVSYIIVQLHDSAGNPVIAKNDIPVSVRIVNPAEDTSINTSVQSPFVQISNELVIQKGSYWGYIPVEFTAAGVNQTFNIDISATGYVISTVPASTTVTTSITSTTAKTVPGSTISGSGTTTITSTTSTNGNTNVTSTSSATGTTTTGNTTATGTTTANSILNTICTLSPISLSTSQVQIAAVAHNFVMDDKTPCFYPLPVLTTGNKELIGVLALKDSLGWPALAKSDLSFQMDSSDTSTVSIPDVEMGYGVQSALVFAQVGNAANPVTLNVVSDSPQQVMPVMASPSQTTSGLVADSLLPTVLPNAQFPLAIYATNNGALDSFKNDFTALISPQETISPIQLTVTKDNPIFLTDETLLTGGSQNIAITTSDYSSSFTVVGASSKPSAIILGYPDQIFSNSDLLFSIELLDDKQLPILADKDTDIKLVSSDPSVLDVPTDVQIKNGSYYATFDAHSKASGTAEIAVLADEIPLSKFDITTTSYPPVVSIDAADHADNDNPLTATLSATYNQLPLTGLSVDWTVTGGKIQNKDSLTNQDGKATISLITDDPNTVNIQASVSGGPYQTITATKQISINPPLSSVSPSGQSAQNNPPPNQQPNSFTIMGISPILFVIPGAAAATFVVLKKKNMLEGISERINITEKFSEMKEKMSNSQAR